jgi:hypothetical protein
LRRVSRKEIAVTRDPSASLAFQSFETHRPIFEVPVLTTLIQQGIDSGMARVGFDARKCGENVFFRSLKQLNEVAAQVQEQTSHVASGVSLPAVLQHFHKLHI